MKEQTPRTKQPSIGDMEFQMLKRAAEINPHPMSEGQLYSLTMWDRFISHVKVPALVSDFDRRQFQTDKA